MPEKRCNILIPYMHQSDSIILCTLVVNDHQRIFVSHNIGYAQHNSSILSLL
ncbi:hypothetical protein Hanom_Chr16g01454181 [Helianthus anomalus]